MDSQEEVLSRHLQAGFLKATLVHRHAFIPSLSRTVEIGRKARVPPSFSSAFVSAPLSSRWSQSRRALARQDGADAGIVLGILRLFGGGGGKGFEGLISRYANEKGIALLEKRSDDWRGKVWLGLALLRQCQFDKARACLDALVAHRPDWSWSYLLRCELGRVDIEFEESLADLNRAAELDPGNSWAYAFRSRVLFQKHPGPEGLKDLDRAVAIDPKAGWIKAWRGDARRKLGDLRGALKDLLEAKALEPGYDRTYLWLGKVLHSLGQDEKALRVLQEAPRHCPHFEKAFSERSRVLRSLGRASEAIRDLNKAAAINHRHDWLGSWTVRPFPLNAEQSRALSLLDAAAARSAWALAWRGEARIQAGDASGGLADLDLALRKAPKLAWAWAWRGEAFVRLGELKKASADLDRAVRLDPGYGRAYAWRGRLRHLQGRHKEAVEDFDKAVGDSLIEYSWLYFWRAEACRALGRSEEAMRDARSALALEPGIEEFRSFRA